MEPIVQWLHIIKELGEEILTNNDTREDIFKKIKDQYPVLNSANITDRKCMYTDINNVFAPYRDRSIIHLDKYDLTPIEKIDSYLTQIIFNIPSFRVDLKHEAELVLDLVLKSI
jgi:hypothetical protein